MVDVMKQTDAPKEAYARYGLKGELSADHLRRQEEKRCRFKQKGIYAVYPLTDSAKEFLHTTLLLIPTAAHPIILAGLFSHLRKISGREINCEDVDTYFQTLKGAMRPLANAAHMVKAYFIQEG